MPCRFKKDLSKAIGIWIIRILPKRKSHYFKVYLWESKEAFLQNTIGNDQKTGASCCFNPTYIDFALNDVGKEIILPKLGEVHFVKNSWNIETVVHELTHALLHTISLWPIKFENWPHEETCYMFGKWVDQIYRELWEVNPGKNWKKNKTKKG